MVEEKFGLISKYLIKKIFFFIFFSLIWIGNLFFFNKLYHLSCRQIFHNRFGNFFFFLNLLNCATVVLRLFFVYSDFGYRMWDYLNFEYIYSFIILSFRISTGFIFFKIILVA